MKSENDSSNLQAKAAKAQKQFDATMQYLGNYQTCTDLYGQLTTAESFGANGVKTLYGKVYDEMRFNSAYWTEFALCLNHKIWEWYDREPNGVITECYNDLWHKADAYALDNFHGADLEHYISVTD